MRERTIYFEYDRTFIKRGMEISPLRLPLQSGLHRFDGDLFEGLPGVFNDSLPDGWGRLLFDRFIRSQGILPADVTLLDRLAHIGSHGLGALVFEPDHSGDDTHDAIRLDNLASRAQDVLDGTSDEVLQDEVHTWIHKTGMEAFSADVSAIFALTLQGCNTAIRCHYTSFNNKRKSLLTAILVYCSAAYGTF